MNEADVIKEAIAEMESEKLEAFRKTVREKLKAIQAQQIQLAATQAQITRLQQELKALKLETFNGAELTG